MFNFVYEHDSVDPNTRAATASLAKLTHHMTAVQPSAFDLCKTQSTDQVQNVLHAKSTS